VPKGKGPWSSWEDSAKYYIHYDGLDDPPAPYDMVVACYMGEKWNGWGYRNKGIFSPYLWAGTNHYSRGKYVADGQYSASAVDQQLGIIAVLFQMVTIDPETYIGGGTPPPPDFNPPPLDPGAAPYSEKGTMWIQSRLNLIMVANSHDPETLNLLKVDGDYGRLTAGVVKDFQTWKGLPADGEAGDVTTAAIDAELAKIK
jgi:peptidoglycan hydrolase-like protein with peptidoglycan-binding domain